MERFKNYLIQEEKSELTVEKYLRDVRRFFVWLGDAELTKNSVLDYKAELVAEYAVASINSIISSLTEYRNALESNDRDKMKEILREGRIAKEEIDG